MVMRHRLLGAALIFFFFSVGSLHALGFCLLERKFPTGSFGSTPSTISCLESGEHGLVSAFFPAQKRIHCAGIEKGMGTLRLPIPAKGQLEYRALAGFSLAVHPSSLPAYQLNSTYLI